MQDDGTQARILEEGDIIVLKEGHQVYAEVPVHFIFRTRRGDFTLYHAPVTLGGDFDYLTGEYVVTRVAIEAGSRPGARNPSPNGHHVYCERLRDRVKVDFFQDGCSPAMISPEEVIPVGRAVLRWVREEPAPEAPRTREPGTSNGLLPLAEGLRPLGEALAEVRDEEDPPVPPQNGSSYFVDGQEYPHGWPTILGLEIQARLPDATRSMKLFREGHAGAPDMQVTKNDAVDLRTGSPYFYTVPRTTWGRKPEGNA